MPIHPVRIAALAALLLAAPLSTDTAEASDAETEITEPREAVSEGDAAWDGRAVGAPPVATPDLSAVPRATLERLAADLALENLLLTRGLTPAAVADDTDVADAELPDDPRQLAAAISSLEERLLALRLRRAELAAAGLAADAVVQAGDDPDAPGSDPDEATHAETPEAPASADADAEVRGTAEGSVPYRYRYSFGLIGHSGRGRVVIRGEDGKLRTEGYNFSEYRDDAVWVKLLFRNDGDTPQRFTGAVALGQRVGGLSRSRARVLATVSLSTPVLQPGEIFETDREVKVDQARDVDFVEVGRVRSFAARE